MGDYFCKTFAMNIEHRASLLRLLEFDDTDRLASEILHASILVTAADAIVDEFYHYLLQHPEYTAVLDEALIPALKRTQSAYLASFGVNFDSSDYFYNRLQVGLAHKRVGLTLGLYQCAYRELQQLILDRIPENFSERGLGGRELCSFVHKVTALDMTLAIEAYHSAHVTHYEDSLEALRDEGDGLREQVNTDTLTGLSRRDYGIEALGKALCRADDGHEVCVIMADIDHFKAINDTYGHLAGDEVLRCVGRALADAVRDFDVVSRYGGEEFMIVLTHASLEVAKRVADRIGELIREMVVEFHDHSIDVTISQGLVEASADSDTMRLLERADAALYLAKQQGRNRVVVSNEIPGD